MTAIQAGICTTDTELNKYHIALLRLMPKNRETQIRVWENMGCNRLDMDFGNTMYVALAGKTVGVK